MRIIAEYPLSAAAHALSAVQLPKTGAHDVSHGVAAEPLLVVMLVEQLSRQVHTPLLATAQSEGVRAGEHSVALVLSWQLPSVSHVQLLFAVHALTIE